MAALGEDEQKDAMADDVDDGNDDEDGVWFLTPLVPGKDAKIKVTVNWKEAVDDQKALFNFWVDFRGDGDMDQDVDHVGFLDLNGALGGATELEADHVIVDADGDGTETRIFQFAVPQMYDNDGSPIWNRITYARARLSGDGEVGLAPNNNLPFLGPDNVPEGEVEDYQVVIGIPDPIPGTSPPKEGTTLDFGDAEPAAITRRDLDPDVLHFGPRHR